MTDYLIGVGAAKSGTSSLYDILAENPAFRRAKKKELHYFDTHEMPDKAEYDALFKTDGCISLDVTPAYMFFDGCMARICETLAPCDVKMIMLLRDPVERAVSHYFMNQGRGMENLSIEAAFARQSERMAKGAMGFREHSYFVRGLYAPQIAALTKAVPADHRRVIVFEDFIRNQQAYADEILRWVGLPPMRVTEQHSKAAYYVKDSKLAYRVRALNDVMPHVLMPLFRPIRNAITRANQAPPPPKPLISETFRRTLIDYYRDDVALIRDRYGIDTSAWKNFTEEANAHAGV